MGATRSAHLPIHPELVSPDRVPPGRGDPGRVRRYRQVRRDAVVGTGEPGFAAVAAAMRAWGIHHGAGLSLRVGPGPPAGLLARPAAGLVSRPAAGLFRRPVRAAPAGLPEPVVGTEFAGGLRLLGLTLWVPCRIVWLRDEPDRYGYGFGTLAGHPESGEEAFEVTLAADGTVRFAVRAFSRPVIWYASLGGRLTDRIQDHVTDRYVAAAQQVGAAYP